MLLSRVHTIPIHRTPYRAEQTRKAYGRFWFRFMNGESGADVYDRATAFWESVFRSMDHSTGMRFQNYVIVTHGLMMVSEGVGSVLLVARVT